MAAQKTCFVIAPIGQEGSETRKRSDQVLRYVIEPAVKTCGYPEAVRADQMPNPGIITSQVVERVMNADLVVADLSEGNANVFYELAIRHAVRKAIVQIIGSAWSIPFDVAPTRTVQFDHHDLDSVEDAKKKIVEQIKAVEKDAAKVDTPLSAAIDLQALRRSDKPQDQLLGEMVSELRSLQSEFSGLRSTLFHAAGWGTRFPTFADNVTLSSLPVGATLGNIIGIGSPAVLTAPGLFVPPLQPDAPPITVSAPEVVEGSEAEGPKKRTKK